jgi:hypothetical protein
MRLTQNMRLLMCETVHFSLTGLDCHSPCGQEHSTPVKFASRDKKTRLTAGPPKSACMRIYVFLDFLLAFTVRQKLLPSLRSLL